MRINMSLLLVDDQRRYSPYEGHCGWENRGVPGLPGLASQVF